MITETAPREAQRNPALPDRVRRRHLGKNKQNPDFVLNLPKLAPSVDESIRENAQRVVAEMAERSPAPRISSFADLGLGDDIGADLFKEGPDSLGQLLDVAPAFVPAIPKSVTGSLRSLDDTVEHYMPLELREYDLLEEQFNQPAATKRNAGLYNQDQDVPSINIFDDKNNPANADYIISLLDIPPLWLKETPMRLGNRLLGRLNSIIQKLQPVAEGDLHKVEEPEPLEDIDLSDPLALLFIKDKMVSAIKAAKIYVKDNLQPIIADGVEPDSVLEMPEPLTPEQMRREKLHLAKQAVAIFVAMSLIGQGSSIKQIEAQSTKPSSSNSGQIFDWEAQEGTINLQSLAQQVTDIINSAKKVTPPVLDTAQPSVAETTTTAEARTEVNELQPYIERDKGVEEHLKLLADAMKKRGVLNQRNFAYLVSTVEMETAHMFKPVCEGFYLDIARGLPLCTTGEKIALDNEYHGGKNYFGRGDIQVTHDTGYIWIGDLLGIDLLNHPEKMLEPQIAADSAVLWFMYKTDWTGNTVISYLNKNDLVHARRPINGSDKAVQLAERATVLEQDVTLNRILTQFAG